MKYKLVDVLILIICSVLSGIDEITKMVEYGKNKFDFLNSKFGVEKIPSKSTLYRILSCLNAEVIVERTIKIMKEILGENGNIIAVDGKEVCSFTNKTKDKLRIVTAYMVENGLVLGQLAVKEKTNEIPCFMELLELIDITGKTITSDAMGTQKEIIAKIVEKRGNYCMCLKGNHKTFHKEISLYFKDIFNDKSTAGEKLYETAVTYEKNSDRSEKRTCCLLKDITWLKKDDWKDLKSIFAIKREVSKGGKKSTEINFYISNLQENPKNFLKIVRSHWKIESMHWMLDVIFNEDNSRLYSQNAEKTLNILRKFALAVYQKYKALKKARWTLRNKMFSTLLNNDMICELVSM